MKISYAITVCNEYEEIQRLITFLSEYKGKEDEIVILFDEVNGTAEVRDYLKSITSGSTYNPIEDYPFRWYSYDFDGHFGNMKNELANMCTGDYIFQIDADEHPNRELLETLPFLLEMNKDVDVILVPRVNTVKGLTQDHIAKWRWSVNDAGWVNWPDYQWRIYKNSDKIKWINKVHERLDGFDQYATLPMEEGFALYHPKDIERQEKQNAYYDTL
jgi:hypothetical protein